MTPHTPPDQLMRRLHTAAGDFRGLLEHEAELLRQWPLPDLWPLHDDKLRQMRELEQCQLALDGLTRQALAREPALTPRAAVASLLDPASRQLWEDSLSLLAECQTLNAGHGAVLGRQQQATRQSLDLLRGGLDQAMTYGRQGMRQHAARNLSLGRA